MEEVGVEVVVVVGVVVEEAALASEMELLVVEAVEVVGLRPHSQAQSPALWHPNC